MSLKRGNDEPLLEEHHPSWRSERGLDWFAFFLADIQTGWGPFVAAYLTSKAWTQLDIGLILTVGTLSAMVLQVPVGALVDLIPGKRLLAAIRLVPSAAALSFWHSGPCSAWCSWQRCCTRLRAALPDLF